MINRWVPASTWFFLLSIFFMLPYIGMKNSSLHDDGYAQYIDSNQPAAHIIDYSQSQANLQKFQDPKPTRTPRPTSTPIPIPPPPEPRNINLMIVFGMVIVLVILVGIWINRKEL